MSEVDPTASPAPETPLPLTGDAWRAELEAWKRDAESRADRYPSAFVLDDSRETIGARGDPTWPPMGGSARLP